MRDPNRIPEIISLLYQVWKKHPDSRLGQLLCNAVSFNGFMSGTHIFSIEDKDLVEGLKKLLEL